MKFFFGCAVILLSLNRSNAQITKIYNGDYENGKAIYQYYENNDLERIFSGNFTYTNTAKTSLEEWSCKHITSGQFKDNLKNGIWEVKWDSKSESNKYYIYSGTRIGNYQKGLRTGEFIYHAKNNIDGKPSEIIVKANFKQNVLIGKILFGKGIDGEIGEDGLFKGSWKMMIGGNEYLAEFVNGIYSKLIVRKIENGEILLKYSTSDYSDTLRDSVKCKIFMEKHRLKYYDGGLLDLKAYGNKYLTEGLVTNDGETKQEKFWKHYYETQFFDLFAEEITRFTKVFADANLPRGSDEIIVKRPFVLVTQDSWDKEY